MRKSFSPSWISSVQPRKQRKYRHEAPLHTRHKFLSAHLSKELRKKYGKRSLPLRAGDEVLIMRGAFAKKKAKIASINVKLLRVTIEGMQRSKRDGTKVSVPFDASNLMLLTLGKDDKERTNAINRKSTPKTVSQTANKINAQKVVKKAK